MSFLLPGFLLAAGAIAAGAVLLHFIVTREPDQLELPTARFAPERTIQARARRFEPRDLVLLLIRVALVLVVGAALAAPVIAPPRREVIRIVMLDRSRAVARPGEAADSARALLRTGDPLILFDSSATVLERNISESLAAPKAAATVPGRISTALIAALRTASRIRDRADSIELVLVSPLAREEVDAATDSIRDRWPGGIRLVPVTPGTTPPAPVVSLESEPSDPLRMALPPAPGNGSAGTVRVLRRLADSSDSAWASQPGRVLVVWPADSEVPGWTAGPPDTVGAVMARGVVVVAPFLRQLSRAAELPGDFVVARWVDGEPAAVETVLGQGCFRIVTINVPRAGDLVLDPRFARLVSVLTEPCGAAADYHPLEPAARARLAGNDRLLRTAAAGIAPAERMATPWSRWLLVAALLLVGLEAVARRKAAG